MFFFYFYLVHVLICTNSSASTFSSKEITGIATSWCHDGSPEDLAEVLGQPIPEEEATDTDKCSTILQKWLEQKNVGDRRAQLVGKLEEKEYYSMAAEVVRLSENYS